MSAPAWRELVGSALDVLTPKNLFSDVVREYAKDYVNDTVEKTYNESEAKSKK